MRLDGRQQLPPHRGLDAVGCDQKLGSNFAAVVKTRDDTLLVLLDRGQRDAMAVDIVGPQTQALPNAIPRCQHLRTRDLTDHIAAPRQNDAAFDGDADLGILLGRESERFVQVVVGGDARAREPSSSPARSWIDTSQPTLRRNSPANRPPIDPPMTTARFR